MTDYTYEFLETAPPDALLTAALEMKYQLEEILGNGERGLDMLTKTQLFTQAIKRKVKTNGKMAGRANQLLVLMIGGCYKRESLMAGIYADRHCDAELPEIKIVDVWIVALRDMLTPIGIEIETIWGQGFRLQNAGRLKEMIEAYHHSGQLPEIGQARKKKYSKPANKEERAQILKLWNLGLSRAAIGRRTNLQPNQINTALTKAQKADPSLYRYQKKQVHHKGTFKGGS